jgi:two-component system cell cycle sensor histidine kinase/response regulator CckA
VRHPETDSHRSIRRRISDALLRRVVEIAHVGGWQADVAPDIDLSAVRVQCSSELVRIFGLSVQGDALPTIGDFLACIAPQDVARLRDAWRSAVSDGRSHTVEHAITQPDGSERIVETRGCVDRDAKGRLVRVVGKVQDVTDQRRVERALSTGPAAEDLLARIVGQSRAAITSTTLDGTITTWNTAAEAMFGHRAPEAIGRSGRMLVPDDRVSELAEHLHAAAAGTRLDPFETVRLRRDGRVVEVEIDCTPVLDGSGAPVGLSIIMRDISQQRRLAGQLQHSQRLESIGQLASGIAHDFNNLLMAIIGYAELAMMDLSEDAPARADLRMLLASADRGARLTRQLLAFGRRQVLRPVTLDLNNVLGEMEGVLHPLITDQVALQLMLAGEPAFVRADRAQLEQVVVNLVANARDAMPGGGQLTIAIDVIDIGPGDPAPLPAFTRGRYVRLTIADAGIGMDAAVQARLFEPFFTTKPRGTSSGMSLATTYGIVKQSDGFITVESAVSAGTAIRVFLPYHPVTAEEPVPPGAAPAREAPRAGRILVVEDDELVRRATCTMLERLRYAVTVAASGHEALHLLRAERIEVDLLLTDVMMPGISGIQLAEIVRAERPELKIVCMSGYPGAVDHDLLKAGLSYLPKPFTTEALATIVAGALAR